MIEIKCMRIELTINIHRDRLPRSNHFRRTCPPAKDTRSLVFPQYRRWSPWEIKLSSIQALFLLPDTPVLYSHFFFIIPLKIESKTRPAQQYHQFCSFRFSLLWGLIENQSGLFHSLINYWYFVRGQHIPSAASIYCPPIWKMI